jgi:hypothetical protein
MRFLPLCLLFTSCAATTFYGPTGKPIARMQCDMVNVSYTGPGTTFQAGAVSHSTATRASGEAAGKVIGSVGQAAVGIGAGIAGSGIVKVAK